jgi:mannose-6-phosphate isomerase-like protein (cupin superfamily)
MAKTSKAKPRKPAPGGPAARKPTSRKSTRRQPAGRKSAGPIRSRRGARQQFTVSHHDEQDFRSGLRNYAKYRDLGISAATGGMVQAHVIRFVPPSRPEEVAKRHYHDVEFQMVYVLKGWLRSEFEGQGEVLLRAGACWIQPPRIKHTVLEYSDDCEVLEIIMPAEFETVMLD